MNAVDEDQSLDHVVDRLAARFPSLPTERIRRAVDVERRRLENETRRDYVTPLVERAAIEELRKDADPVRLRGDHNAPEASHLPVERHGMDPLERARLERSQHGGFLLPDPDSGLVSGAAGFTP